MVKSIDFKCSCWKQTKKCIIRGKKSNVFFGQTSGQFFRPISTQIVFLTLSKIIDGRDIVYKKKDSK